MAGRAKKAAVKLDAEQRAALRKLVRTGDRAAALVKRANILLKADVDGPAWPDARIAEAFGASLSTVARTRAKFVAGGLEAALERRKPTGRQYRKLDGGQEAQLVALACSAPPAGHAKWTMKLLAGRLVELQVVAAIDASTVCRTLKKTRSSPGCGSSGSSRPAPTPGSSRRWRTCSTSPSARTIPAGRRSASTKPASS